MLWPGPAVVVALVIAVSAVGNCGRMVTISGGDDGRSSVYFVVVGGVVVI